MDIQEPKEPRELNVSYVGDVAADFTLDGIVEGAFEVASSVGETVIGDAAELVGGILEGI